MPIDTAHGAGFQNSAFDLVRDSENIEYALASFNSGWALYRFRPAARHLPGGVCQHGLPGGIRPGLSRKRAQWLGRLAAALLRFRLKPPPTTAIPRRTGNTRQRPCGRDP